MAGKVSELHEQVGAMVALAEEKGIAVPAMACVLAALLPQQRAAEARAKEAAAAPPCSSPAIAAAESLQSPWLRAASYVGGFAGGSTRLGVTASPVSGALAVGLRIAVARPPATAAVGGGPLCAAARGMTRGLACGTAAGGEPPGRTAGMPFGCEALPHSFLAPCTLGGAVGAGVATALGKECR